MSEETKQIPLGNDMFATVDAADFDALSRRKWHLIPPPKNGANTYAGGWPNPRGDAKCQDRLHRVIMGAKKGEDVRFLDGNGLNCCRSNLQIVTHSELRMTARRMSRNTSGAKGVSFGKQGQRRWRAYICVNKKQINLGQYATFDEALAARKYAEVKYHGAFAKDEALGEGDPAQPRVLDVTWFPRTDIHHLTEIDSGTQRATCSICGQVKIKPSGKPGNWKCQTKVRECRFKHRKTRNKNRDLIRRPQILHKKDHCERCTFIAAHPCQLDVHHRDYDCKNNAPENLETLCSNCHRLETQMKRDEIFQETDRLQWVGSKKRKANLHTAGA